MTITVYSRPQCVQCNATKRFLNKRGVPFFEETMTEEQAKAFRDRGLLTLPIVVLSHNDQELQIISGFSPDKLQAMTEEVNQSA